MSHERAVQKTGIIKKIEKIYHKISKQKSKLEHETVEEKKVKRLSKVAALLEKLVRKKIKLYKQEIASAKELKQDGILIPLAKRDHGCIYTDDIHDLNAIIQLAKLQHWSKKCFWLDLKTEEYIIIRL